jgi:two-component system, NtrC family, nitrogen regulation sensor histidine kinase NtrY
MVEAFNTMAGELAASQRKLERSRVDLERKNVQLDERRRYIETVLERIATGVVSMSADGRIETINGAAIRLLDVERTVIGTAAEDVFQRDDLKALGAVLRNSRATAPAVQEFALARQGRELHLAAAATALQGDDGSFQGSVLVFDDVTPLIRTQRVAAWRDVARRLAHEIKNPLTPIQLCAERMRRHFMAAPPASRELVDECTTTIVGEVESLKALVDEFAQFARMPAPKTVPSDLNALLSETLALYNGLVREIALEPRFESGLPPVRVDVEQIRRVVINLVDNAVEALGGSQATLRPDGDPPRIVIETRRDAVNGVARIVVADNGPGIPAADRDKLFMPYYSTKQRGSGLGLAIVRRIIAEHGGAIDVQNNDPQGTRFVIELPV